MSLNPQINVQPIVGMFIIGSYQNGTGTDADSGIAISQALAVLEASPVTVIDIAAPPVSANVASTLITFFDVYRVSMLGSKYRVAGYSATCFLQVFWDEVTYSTDQFGGSKVEVSRAAKSFTFTLAGVGGVCLPGGFDVNTPATWYASGDMVVTQPMPDIPPFTEARRLEVDIENFVWSQLDGYTPPSDGSANGFPI